MDPVEIFRKIVDLACFLCEEKEPSADLLPIETGAAIALAPAVDLYDFVFFDISFAIA